MGREPTATAETRKLAAIMFTDAEEVLRISPNFSLEVLWKRLSFKNPAGVEHLFAAARKAGLK
jgi:hypothetical protein